MNRLWLSRTLLLFFFSMFVITGHLHGKTIIALKPLNEQTYAITLDVNLAPGDFVYKDYITISVDHPDVTLSDWQASSEPIDHYDPAFKKTKKIFNKSFSITLQAQTKKTNVQDAYLHFSSYHHKKKKIAHELFHLSLASTTQAADQTDNEQVSTESNKQQKKAPLTAASSWSSYISMFIKTSQSWWLRIVLALLLGILLSLTPCIYPMIPITIGILQAQGSNSLLRNFTLALAYTVGIATTFSLFGLIAAFTGSIFGSIMSNPVVVITIVTLLIYLAGSILGLYDMYIPSFLQPKNTTIKGGSIVTAFFFGAASGTIASPCLSPGLVLLLSLVTTLGSKLLGFALLFSFGIGLSLPLLVIGSFSSSLSLLPQAGSWMVEIKQFFGFMILGMCFYFLQNILPWHMLLWSFSLFILSTGIFYLYQAKDGHASGKQYKNIFGAILVTSAVVLAAQSLKETIIKNTTKQTTMWLTDYAVALEKAKQEKKQIFLKISAPFCSLCKAIDKKLFTDASVLNKLQEVIAITIDNADNPDENTAHILKKFNIIGVPTFIIINPETETEVNRWESELYDETPATFIATLDNYRQ